MSRSLRSSLRQLGAASLIALALCSACGNAGLVEDARYQIQIGHLEGAERILSGASGPEVQALRAEIAEVREARRELGKQLTQLERLSPEDERFELDALLRQVTDPNSVDRIESAISNSVDRAAEERVTRRDEKTRQQTSSRNHRAGEESVARSGSATDSRRQYEQRTRETAADSAGLDAARAAVLVRIDDREWGEALAEIEMALPVAGTRAGEFRNLRTDVQDRALGEVLGLLGQAEKADEEGRLEDAYALLEAAAPRFPHSGSGVSLRDAMEEYEGRIAIIALADEGERIDEYLADSSFTSPDSQSGDPAQRAAALERGGDLAAALDAYLDAGFAALPGPERDGLIARARGVERRLLLRTEILKARATMPAEFEEEFGLLGGDETLLELENGRATWDEWSLAKLKRAASRSNLSQEAQLGLLGERLLRGDTAGRGGALASLAKFVKEGVIEEAAAWELVAEQRDESVPDGGYVWDRNAWISKQDKLDEAQAELLASLEKQFGKAKTGAERDEVWDSLGDLGPAALATRTSLLEARWEKALKAVQKGSTLSALARVAQEREELDHRRKVALELIFDEEEYFYPYNPPECPPEKARLYWPVQQRVDELVSAVREVWEASKPVKLSAGFRDGLADLSWAIERSDEIELALAVPEEFPAWIWSVPVELSGIGLREFAWNETEREQLAYNRSIAAYNTHTWAQNKSFAEDEQSENGEQRQVEITNEYRQMFGRLSVAWNPKIQVAAGMHSDYMADTGDFGHFEKGDPERRSPFDRMRLAGYNYGASENCHMGSGSPEGAHNGWIHSSGHHRNILMPGHREMASAMTGSYWTQNFGTGKGFQADLDKWQD